MLLHYSKLKSLPCETINVHLDQYCKCDDILMLLGLFHMYSNRKPLIGWHSVCSNYLGGFYVERGLSMLYLRF